jgi:hypothetical protein
MASTSHNSSPHGSVKYNHFHEYDSDNEELFEIREMTITPEPIATVPIPAPTQTRVSKLKHAIGMSLLRKKSQRKTGDEVPAKGTTLPRPSKERNECVERLADQMFGRGEYHREPKTSKPERTCDKPEPKPFTSVTFPRRAKSVRWTAQHEIQNIQNVRFENTAPHAESKTTDPVRGHERQKSREDNPNWLQEFELPEPTLTNPLETKSDSDPDDYFNIKELFADKAVSPAAEEPTPWISSLAAKFDQRTTCETVPDEDSDTNFTVQSQDHPSPPPKEPHTRYHKETSTSPLKPAWKCKCGRTTCTTTSVHTLTEEGVRSSLGHDIADSIAKELLVRVGLPPPPPLKDPLEEESLLLREKEVIENYATWAAICLFQKLVLSIKISLDTFKPNHRGVISFDFGVLSPIALHLRIGLCLVPESRPQSEISRDR